MGRNRTAIRWVAVWGSLATALAAAGAERDWIKAATPNFELYTNGGEGAAKRTLLHFEQIRAFFLEAMGQQGDNEQPIRIVAFRSEKEYEPYSPRALSSAFYLSGPDRDYIVIAQAGAENYETAVHEYVHFLIKHAGVKIPVWFNEGLADFYSTLKPAGAKVRVGDLPAGRLLMVRQGKWIPMADLLAAGHGSREYNSKDHVGMFYSQSWALTHMLRMDSRFSAKGEKLVAALDAGADSIDAIRAVYGLSPEELEKALRLYVRRERFYASLFDVKLSKAAEQPVAGPAPPVEVELSLAQILASYADRRSRAEEMLRKLAAEHPASPAPHEALGYSAWRGGDREAARGHFARAAELGSTNPKMFYDYAAISRNGDPRTVAELLERSLELDPENHNTRRLLGLTRLQTREWAKAVLTLNQVKKVETNEEAFSLFHGRAFAFYHLNQPAEAKTQLELARKYAGDERLTGLADALAAAIARRQEWTAQRAAAGGDAEPAALASALAAVRPELAERPFGGVHEFEQPPSVAGKLVRFECLAGTARMHLEIDGASRTFALRDPAAIVIVGKGGEVEFTCGPQDGRPVRLEYAEEADEPNVTLIEFLDQTP